MFDDVWWCSIQANWLIIYICILLKFTIHICIWYVYYLIMIYNIYIYINIYIYTHYLQADDWCRGHICTARLGEWPAESEVGTSIGPAVADCLRLSAAGNTRKLGQFFHGFAIVFASMLCWFDWLMLVDIGWYWLISFWHITSHQASGVVPSWVKVRLEVTRI